MSWTTLGERVVTARKQHDCIWCGESIMVSEAYKRITGVSDGEFQDGKWHIECDKAAQANYDWYDETFPAYAFKRGTIEEK